MTSPIDFPVSRLTSIIIPFASSSPGGRLSVSTSPFTWSIASSRFPALSNVATRTYTAAPFLADLATLPVRKSFDHGDRVAAGDRVQPQAGRLEERGVLVDRPLAPAGRNQHIQVAELGGRVLVGLADDPLDQEDNRARRSSPAGTLAGSRLPPRRPSRGRSTSGGRRRP